MSNLPEIRLLNRGANPELLLRNHTYSPDETVVDLLNDAERNFVENRWQERLNEGFYNSEIGSLWDTQNNQLNYIQCDYKTYDAIANGHNNFRSSVLEKIRPSSTGVVVETSEGLILTQRRAPNLLAGNMLDSSVANMASVGNNYLHFEKVIYRGLYRELGLSRSDFREFDVTGAHRTLDYFATQFTFSGKVNLDFEEIRGQSNPKYVTELLSIPKEDLPDFIVQQFALDKNLIADGTATFLASLDGSTLLDTTARINELGGTIKFGYVAQGIFVEDAINSE